MSPNDHQNTRQRILDAALERIALRGYAGTSMSEIAQLAGLSKAGLYNYFDSKEELLMELLDDCLLAWSRASQPALTAPGPLERRLRGHLVAAVNFASDSPHEVGLVRLAATQLGGDLGRRVQERLARQKEEHSARLMLLMQKAIDDGEVEPADAQDYVLLWRMVLDGLLMAVIFQTPEAVLVETRLDTLWSTLWRAFAARGTEEPSHGAGGPYEMKAREEML